jgi:hypothetical protein
MSRLFILSATAVMVLCLAIANAQHTHKTKAPQPDSKTPSLDNLSTETFKRWHALDYHLGRAGVNRFQMKIQVESKSSLGTVSTSGAYSHDGKQGSLQWDKPELAAMLVERGWSASTFDRWLDKNGLLTNFGTAKLSATKQPDGSIKIKVKGNTASGYTSLTFDPTGRLAWVTLAASPSASRSKPEDTQIEMRHKAVGKQFLTTGWRFHIKNQAGTLTGETQLSHRIVAGRHVIHKTSETLTIDGKTFGTQILTFSEHKINVPPTTDKKPKNTPKPSDGKSLETPLGEAIPRDIKKSRLRESTGFR